MGVAVAMRSSVSFWAGVTKNEAPCCFTSMLKAAVGTGEDCWYTIRSGMVIQTIVAASMARKAREPAARAARRMRRLIRFRVVRLHFWDGLSYSVIY